MSSKVFLITSDVMGKGDDELGGMLMGSFLRILADSAEKPVKMIFLNTGVRLVCEGSSVLNHIKKLEEQGVEILACTTCLKYFDFIDKIRVGSPTTMPATIQSMMTAETVTL